MVCTDSLTEYLAHSLRKKGLTLSVAESCTGGLISSRITDIPGSSEFFLGAAVTYSDTSKTAVLNVDADIVKEYGAVSAETADLMSAGAAATFASDISAAVTGIAGPSGGSETKPVGLVFISVRRGDRVRTTRNIFKGTRAEIRSAASDAVMSMIISMAEE
jgi:PncC family amidohydrolase